jgi:HEAT repeat protein
MHPAVLQFNHIGSASLLASFGSLAGLAGLLLWTGVLGGILRLVRFLIQTIVQCGFFLWKTLLSWADWPALLVLVLIVQAAGCAANAVHPLLVLLCGLALLFVGVTTSLAYVFIDLERDEVARGYKALHKPLIGQQLAVNLVRFGRKVGVPLLITATIGTVGGFALFNQGLYNTIGEGWYSLGEDHGAPGFLDFLAYTLINLFRVVDLLNIAQAYNYIHVTYVHQARWPAATLLVLFRSFFTLVLLEQIFTLLRRQKLLMETINDFWSPHPPIHERARGSLPQHGVAAVRALLLSLRTIKVLTAEQRAFIPLILADIGPGALPVLMRRLADPHADVRAVAAATLGQLHAVDAVPALARLAHDDSEWVRQSLAEALGLIGAAAAHTRRPRRFLRRALRTSGRWLWYQLHRKKPARPTPAPDPIVLAVTTLRAALADPVAAVRIQAARSLGLLGSAAATAARELIARLHDDEEVVRGEAAEALGKIGALLEDTVPALVELLHDPNASLQVSAARALGLLKEKGAPAVAALIPLLQEQDETIRTAAAEAIGQIGTLDDENLADLTGGLASRDNLVRAQTAEVLGAIGPAAAEAAPVLADALSDPNDHVRAKAAAALGALGEDAGAAVPQLVRALRDQDNWVSALAAEALGEIGEPAAAAVPALVRSLGHMNPQVRANAARALGKIGPPARSAVAALAKVAQEDEDDVRCPALAALGAIGDLPPAPAQTLLGALEDANPKVRAAAVEAVGQRLELKEASLPLLLRLLDDATDVVKVELTRALPTVAGAAPAVISGLTRWLTDNDPVVQAHAAQALGKLGAAAAGAVEALVRVARIGEAEVREQALRALALIQPPEAPRAFRDGIHDAVPAIRKVASAGLVKAATIPAAIVPALIEALHDPEIQVRANAAQALARLTPPPAAALAPLIECTQEPDDGLRLHAALALRDAAFAQAGAAFQRLLGDHNPRLRLLAADYLLRQDAADAPAAAVVAEALADSRPRIRRAALDLIDSLGERGVGFLDLLEGRVAAELEPEVSDRLAGVTERLRVHRLEPQTPVAPA